MFCDCIWLYIIDSLGVQNLKLKINFVCNTQ